MVFNKLIVALFAIFLPVIGSAQFYTHGEITYQRTYNLKLAMQLEDQYKWIRRFAERLPDDITAYYTLNFNSQKTAYSFEKDSASEDARGLANFLPIKRVAYKNQVWSDLTRHTRQALKQVYEEHFLVSDSMADYQWKIEDDIRSIAGFSCRKAVTTMDDSVVVVAFYTDQIMVSGGPESFNGLPGMILGLAIPRLYTTWFATKVTITTPEFAAMELPKKTNKVTKAGFLAELNKATKSWRGDVSYLFWLATL